MPKKNLTASEFVLQTLAADQTLEWRVGDLMEKAAGRWTEANVYNTLTRLHAAGKIKRTKDGHAAWWSAPTNIVSTPEVSEPASMVPVLDPAEERAPAAKIQPPELAVEGPTAQAFIVDLLTRHPDYEMQVADIWEESARKWKQQTVANTLERLVVKGIVTRVKDGRNVWFSIAG